MKINNIKSNIRFRKKGIIELSNSVTNALNIQDGDVINFYSENSETYLYVSVRQPAINSYRGVCRSSKNKGRHMRVSWASVTRKIIVESGQEEAHYRVGDPVERLGTTMLPIITRINLYQND